MDELSRDDLLAVLDELPVGLALYEPRLAPDGSIEDLVTRYANHAIRAMVDVPDLVGHGLAEQIPENRSLGLLDRYIRVYETGVPSHEARVRMDAQAVRGTFDVHARRVGDLLLLHVEDVTRELDAERVEAEARQRVVTTLERINDAVYALDREWRFTFVNDAAGRLLGWDPHELIGRDVWETFPGAVGAEIERHYRHAMAYDEKVSFEAYYPEPLDSWYVINAYPSGDGLTVFFQDIGAKRRVEARALALERLESSATLAGGAAHDFNNLLMVISGHGRLLAETLDPDDPRREDVAAIEAAVDRGRELTGQLLSFSRAQDLRPTVVDLGAVVESVGPTLRQSMPSTVHVEVRLAGEPVLVDIDRAELERALLHLASNAAHAMPDGGVLEVEVSTEVVDERGALRHPDRNPGAYGVVTVSDDGEGMPEAVLRRAVEPFFSTKRSAGATGLGLAAVDGLVRQAGGHLSIDSQEGVGTTVRLHLPRSASDAAHPAGFAP